MLVLDEKFGEKLTQEQRRARRQKAREAADITSRHPRRFTISSLADGQSADSLSIPLQATYEGTYVISSEEASMKLRSPHELLEKLNEVMGTAHTFERYPELLGVLQEYISQEHDFGYTYGLLRIDWDPDPTGHLPLSRASLTLRADEDRAGRAVMLDAETGMITKPFTPPRRVWDLYSNRVVSYWAVVYLNGAISHSWMDTSLRQYIETPINNKEWPVPMPIDTTLERVRIEMLNLGWHAVWLDVLCLRQRGSQELEDTRKQEWALDVPTIGYVYSKSGGVVHYYSGLGRPFYIGDLNSPRHRLNRAWTLQELTVDVKTAGIAKDSPMLSLPGDVIEETGEIIDAGERTFWNTLSWLSTNCTDQRYSIFPILDAMRHRSAESELDKIAGLAYLLMAQKLPPYLEDQPREEAWDALVRAMEPRFRGDLLFLFPDPGDARYKWYPSALIMAPAGPSWGQIKAVKSLPKSYSGYEPVECTIQLGRALYHSRAYRFEKIASYTVLRRLRQTAIAGNAWRISVCPMVLCTLSLCGCPMAIRRHTLPSKVGRATKTDFFEKITVLQVRTAEDATKFKDLYRDCLESHRYHCYYA